MQWIASIAPTAARLVPEEASASRLITAECNNRRFLGSKANFSAWRVAGRMPVEIPAGYRGERSVEVFLCRVGMEYPEPVIKAGRRQLWLKDDLDNAIRADCPTAADFGAELP
jgi:hypothetical protein